MKLLLSSLSLFLLFSSNSAQADLTVIKKQFQTKIELKLVRASLGSFDIVEFINENSRKVEMVCANNRAYDQNKKAFITFENFYGRGVDRFEIESNQVCQDLKKFVFITEGAVDEERPFKIEVNLIDQKVSKITYPDIDPYAIWGDMNDLFNKDQVRLIQKHYGSKKTNSVKDILK